LAASLSVAVSAAAADDQGPTYPYRTDPSVPGGTRLGDDDRDDNFDGYPDGPRDPDDAYFDTTAEYRAYTPNWTGSFVGGGLIGGFTRQNATFFDSPVRDGLFGAFLQAASTQLVIDGELAYTQANTQAAIGGEAVEINRHSLSAAGLVHPFFLGNIRGGWFAFVVPGIYGTAGLSWNWASLKGKTQNAEISENGWHVGGGFDIPIDSPQDGGAFWAGLQYRYQRITDNRDVLLLRDGLFSEQQLLFKLAYRHNGNLLVGKMGPDSL
jgi:hypothetical protein